MLPTQRRQAILAELRQAKAVSAEELARRFGVSLETIRRDLRGLRDRGLLERVYGGALPVRSTEGDFATRSTLHATSKLAIAQLAATLVEPEDTIVIDIGTTALEVARALPASFRGRVLTNSVPAALELSGREHIEVLLCGGLVRGGDGALEQTPAGRAMTDRVVTARREELEALLADERAGARPEVIDLLRRLSRELAGQRP